MSSRSRTGAHATPGQNRKTPWANLSLPAAADRSAAGLWKWGPRPSFASADNRRPKSQTGLTTAGDQHHDSPDRRRLRSGHWSTPAREFPDG